MTDRWIPATLRLHEDDRRRFKAVRLAITEHAAGLRMFPGVVNVRPGYRFKDGWITDLPAVVVTVHRKMMPDQVPTGQMIPRELDGVPVDVCQATPLEQLSAESTTRGMQPTPSLPPEYQPALPDADDGEDATRSADFATRAASQPYVPPPGLALDAVEGAMTVVCHASPDAGWDNLGPFLAATKHRLTVAMFDFSAPHILKSLAGAMALTDGPLKLVLDPALTLNRSKDPNSPKANDITEEVVRDELERAVGDRFTIAWAAVKRAGKTTGGIFASAYHIKVAVRDGTSFWLSSGNWQSSNQPDPERLGPGVDPDHLLRAYNREWHVVVDHPGLARVFEQYIEHDLAQAVPLQRALDDVLTGFPDVFVPVDDLPRTRGMAQLFPGKTFTFTAQNPVKVQPLLTPDNYAGHIRDLIRSARKSLYFQNQYISVARLNAGPFAELIDALREKVNDEAIDARIILRESGDTRAMLEALKAQGFRTDRIRLQRTCHNKGIIVDGRVVALGSHNWSSDGTTANRDATLIFHSPEIARYYEAIFLFDWDNRSRHRIITDTPRGMPILARADEPTPPGMVRLSWGDFIEEAGEAAQVATLAMGSAGTKPMPMPAVTRPFLPEVSSPMNRPEVIMPDSKFSKTIHALLVGIDQYNPPVPKLSGCVNDIDAFESFLNARAAGIKPQILTLRNEQATRAAMIAGFRDHLGKAQAGDVALLYYAGHGSQEPAPPEFWHLEPDKLDETLVCYDSREAGKFDLADKELNKLIDEVASKGAHVVAILDCCHSGSGTRNLEGETMPVRRAPLDSRSRPVGSFLVSATEASRLAGTRGVAGGKASSPVGRHVLLAACRDEQVASEYRGDGKPRGAFSYFLGDTLRTANGPLTYRDLFARTNVLLKTAIGTQSAQLEATSSEDLDALFLDGAIQPTESYFLIARDGPRWTMAAGSVHGVPRAEPDATMELALFPFDATPEVLKDRSKSKGTARVVEVGPTSSLVEIQGVTPGSADTFKGVPITLPLPALAVSFEGDAEGIELARQALAQAGPNGKPSLYVREARDAAAAEFRLLARSGQYRIARPIDDRPIVGQLDGYGEENARKAIQRLEHMARWSIASRLANPASSIARDELEMTIVQGEKELTGSEIRLSYEYTDGKWVPPQFMIRLRNHGSRRLYAALLDLTETFRISAALQESGSIALDPGQEAWAYRKRPIPATVPDELWRQGVVEIKDILKLIVCTTEFDARLMEQPALDLPRPAPPQARSVRQGGLDALMKRVQTRNLGDDNAASLDDWTATSVVFTTVRPLESAPVPATGAEPAKLAGGVKLRAHPKLSAKARLNAAPTASRDLGKLALPRILRDDATSSEPFVIAPTRSGSAGLSVLELTDVQNRESVTPAEPLTLDVPATTAPGEHVLPVGFDGEFFLPLGRAVSRADGGTEIIIERLPGDHGQESSLPEDARRSLGGSIKIFFQKVICAALGREFEYPLLAAADLDDAGGKEEVIYEHDTEKIRARVAGARKILLLIHGVIGDTLELRRGMRRAKVGPEKKPIDSLYDLVLTLDYENLNTPIEDVARKLKQRLGAVGLGPDHGKELTIVAHSMGGLVSRWFIEQEGGNKVVKRLIMCGTPNGGSPWPSVHDWAITTLSLGLNSLAGVAWPAAAAGWLVSKLEDLDVNLDQMQPDSPFLKELAKGQDPGIPYLMVAGNTSLVPAAVTVDASGTSPLDRLMGRLSSKPLLHTVAGKFFGGLDNDIAASIPSMENVPGPRKPIYDVRPVACDHISYFADAAGLKALALALGTG